MTRRVLLSYAVARVFYELVNTGASNGQIAMRLYLSVDCVKSHIKTILRAFDCHDRAAVVAAYHRGDVEVWVK